MPCSAIRARARSSRSAYIVGQANAVGSSAISIEVVQGDLVVEAGTVDAIVNAANSSLLGGGGVDGAIHRAAGPALLRECRALRASALPDGLPAGRAVATGAGALPCRWVIHTVGPVYAAVADPAGALSAAYRSSLAVADELGCGSVAFPAISCGVYGYPLAEAAPVAVAAVRSFSPAAALSVVRFVLFSPDAFARFEAAARG